MRDRCPSCKQVLNAVNVRVRHCGKCGRPIALHDKWTFVFKGKSVQMQHRHCDNPEDYLTIAERRRKYER